MKKKKVKKAAVVPAAVVPKALGTQKKKKTATASAKQNLKLLSNLDEESIFLRKAPPEDMPSYVLYGEQNTPRLTRAVPMQPPALIYLSLLPPIVNDDCNPLDHKSPHKKTPAEFVEEAAHAADPSDAMKDDDDEEEEERIICGTFPNLVGGEKPGLDDLSYSFH